MAIPSVSGTALINPKVLREIETLLKTQAMALHSWMSVEDGLGLVFAAVMRSPDRILPFAALSAVQFDAKLRIVDAAAQELLLNHDLLNQWGSVKNKIGRIVRTRNVLAHSRVEMFADKAGMMWRLYPAASNITGIRKTGDQSDPRNVFDEKRLNALICSFEISAKRLTDFAELVAAAFPSPSK